MLGTGLGQCKAVGVYAVLFKDRKVFFGDCTVNVDPDAETLAEIALNTARVAETFGVRSRGWRCCPTATSASIATDPRGAQGAPGRRDRPLSAGPTSRSTGEMQADTAVDFEQGAPTGVPLHAASTGPANVLVFPDLTSGNIAYKLLLNLTDAEAVGPLLVGIGSPVNVIPTHATETEIVNVVTYTAIQALERKRAAG